ncbi:hypothetical protein Hanom_Chr11g00994441 [Helianthus anomalus]
MNVTRSELSNRPEIFYVQSYEIGVSKKVNPVEKIPGSATAVIGVPRLPSGKKKPYLPEAQANYIYFSIYLIRF